MPAVVPQKSWKIIFALGSLAFTGMSATDLYIPSLPQMTAVFDTSEAMVQLTLTLYMLGFAISSLIIGPLIDNFGYRKPLVICMLVFMLTSYACVFIQNIEQFIALRLLQGLSVAIESVMGITLISVLFEGRERIKMMSIFGMVIAVGPVVAPILGGYVALAFGWSANFVLLSLFGGLSLALALMWLPAVVLNDNPPLMRKILHSYAQVVKSHQFLRFNLLASQIELGLFAVISGGPFLFINHYGVSSQHFGYFLAALVLAYIGSSLIVARLSHKISQASLIRGGALLIMLGPLSACGLIYGGVDNPYTLTAALSLSFVGVAPVYSCSNVLAMEAIETRYRGTASAAMTCSFMAMGGLSAFAVSLFDPHNPYAIGIMFLASGVLAMLLAAARIPVIESVSDNALELAVQS